MLCNVCQSIFQGNFNDSLSNSFGRDHHHSPRDLELAASNGCYICDALWRRYQFRKPATESGDSSAANTDLQESSFEPGRSNFSRYDLEPIVSAGETIGIELTIALNVYFLQGATLEWSYECSLCSFRLQPNSGLLSSFPRSTSTEPDSYVAVARHWLETCLQKHPTCTNKAAQKNTLKLPARLLRISSPTPKEIRLWIVPDDTETQSVKYMTLSHCWGTSPFLTLTAKTLQKLIKGILISELPKTFRDAVLITHQMGVNFLWIDSLCIMQDSLSDWEQEASLMADVYRGSLCNLAATGSSHANEGCYYERRAPVRPNIITTAWVDTPNQEFLLSDSDFWAGIFENDPLRQRAWVVQELLLSPRILHLGKRQMIWECYQSSLCELYPGRVPKFIGRIPKKLPLERMIFEKVEDGNGYLVFSWSNLVHSYTSCNLTNPGDKLIALSGIAKLLQESTQDEYLAGLWKRHLPSQLLWESESDQAGPLIPAKTYRAPSWSWACVDGRISCPSWKRQCLFINILEASVEPAGFDRTGAVKSGLVRLTSPLTTIELEEIEQYNAQSQYRFRFRTSSNEWHDSAVICKPSSLVNPNELHCLAVNKRTAEGYRDYDCLLLMPTKSTQGQFYRWGLLQLGSEDGIHDFHISQTQPFFFAGSVLVFGREHLPL